MLAAAFSLADNRARELGRYYHRGGMDTLISAGKDYQAAAASTHCNIPEVSMKLARMAKLAGFGQTRLYRAA